MFVLIAVDITGDEGRDTIVVASRSVDVLKQYVATEFDPDSELVWSDASSNDVLKHVAQFTEGYYSDEDAYIIEPLDVI